MWTGALTRRSANVTTPASQKPTVWTIGAGLTKPRAGCLAGRYVVITGGSGSKGCNTAVWMLDTKALPAPGSALPVIGTLNGTGSVAVAGSLHGDAVGFYDGTTLDIFHL